ncbi:MAG: tRNA (adenosine(37)-N6)-dimethylallyltransferase MiaA [Bacteroidetes bacterium]|nr:tRNA (adenosine(37)-N6)-dimethylallyltransferase MiaA [Bacteroidota bacterium]
MKQNSEQKAILAIVGPTASGKTHLSLILANRLDAEIVSADSRQVYKYLTIGTAKPTKDELRLVPHHFIDILDPREDYSAGQYGNEARKCIENIHKRGKQPLLVGGSGLYVKAVIDGLFEGVGKSEELRKQLLEELNEYGAEWLYNRLQSIDPAAATTMDPTKIRRVIRALEVYYLTGKPISFFHLTQQKRPPFKIVQVGLFWERSELYLRIDQRVDAMINGGFLDEVRWLQENGYSRTLNALNTVGYKEAFDYFEGIISYATMIELIKRNTRRFAKRQLTWYRADQRIRWFPVSGSTEWEQLAGEIIEYFRKCTEN